MELLWVLKASLGFPVRHPEEMSAEGLFVEVFFPGLGGGTQLVQGSCLSPRALMKSLILLPSVPGTRDTSSFLTFPLILLPTWHNGLGA